MNCRVSSRSLRLIWIGAGSAVARSVSAGGAAGTLAESLSRFPAGGSAIVVYPDCQVNMATAEITKSSTITTNEDDTTALVVAQPTPSEPPLVRKPQYPATIGIAAPYAVHLTVPVMISPTCSLVRSRNTPGLTWKVW